MDPHLTHALLEHVDLTRRPMPWRETSDPYAIWVSEIMLQQTRVDTVIPYWNRWLERFPTVEHLARADLDDVLKEWEGLGYYSRARNLHSAARMVRERYEGRVPADPGDLRRLPGVGEYTAGAVASIAYGVATPAVDGNVRRVLARLYDLERPTPAALRDLAADLVPADRPGDFNQALMELGATICTPRSPDCPACPLAEWCAARRLDVQEERPLPKKRRPIPEEEVRTVILVRDDGAVLLGRRPEDGLLGGLWEFPGEPLPDEVAALLERPDQERPSDPLEPVTHTFSHKRVTYRPEILRVPAGDERSAADGPIRAADRRLVWTPLDRLDDFALPVAQQKIARQLATFLLGSSPR
jgi:A/G-specific adenine glycosylase